MSSDNLVNQLITLSKLHPYALQINGTTGKVEESGIKIEDTEILDLFPQLRGALIKQLTGLKCYASYPDGLINEFTAQLIFVQLCMYPTRQDLLALYSYHSGGRGSKERQGYSYQQQPYSNLPIK